MWPTIVILLALAVFARIWLRALMQGVRDSNDFATACQLWSGVIAHLFDSPREVKRWINRVRYINARMRKIEPAPNYWQRIDQQTQNHRHRPWFPAILLSLLKAIRPVPATIEPALPEAQLVALTALMSAATHFGLSKELTAKVEGGMAFTLAEIAQVFPDQLSFTDPRAMVYADLNAQIAHCLQTLQVNPVRLPPGTLKQFITIAKEFTLTEQAIAS